MCAPSSPTRYGITLLIHSAQEDVYRGENSPLSRCRHKVTHTFINRLLPEPCTRLEPFNVKRKLWRGRKEISTNRLCCPHRTSPRISQPVGMHSACRSNSCSDKHSQILNSTDFHKRVRCMALEPGCTRPQLSGNSRSLIQSNRPRFPAGNLSTKLFCGGVDALGQAEQRQSSLTRQSSCSRCRRRAIIHMAEAPRLHMKRCGKLDGRISTAIQASSNGIRCAS